MTHDGTLVFEFDDLPSGTLIRQSGVPVVRAHIPLQPGLQSSTVGGGQADFHEGAVQHGILMNQLSIGDAPALFRFFDTGLRPLPAAAVSTLGGSSLALVTALLVLATLSWHLQRSASRR